MPTIQHKDKPRVWRYVMPHDTGLAPCFEDGLMTLALCKPLIRKNAKVGDWLMGYASKKDGKSHSLIYYAKITSTPTMHEYMDGVSSRTDHIYSKNHEGVFEHNGRSKYHLEKASFQKDWSVDRVIVSEKFKYFKNRVDTVGTHVEPLYYGHVGQKYAEVDKDISAYRMLQNFIKDRKECKREKKLEKAKRKQSKIKKN